MLDSFKEILLKKADGNPLLQEFIQKAQLETLTQEVLESLMKMARPSAALGRNANSALTSYAANMDNSDVEQLRDALGHHISHYKGALKAMQAAPDEKKPQLRSVADQHLSRILPLMHLAGRASQHSNNRLGLDYVSTVPWESNYTTIHRHDHNGKLKEGTKDLGRRASPGANRSKNIRAVPDYRYLEMPPHPGHADTGRIPHQGGYPFEETQLGSPTKIDQGQAYLPISDVGAVDKYIEHPFDRHPVHAIADIPESHLTSDQKAKFASDLADWKSSEHHQKWLNDQKEKFKADPEGYKKRGLTKPGHHFEGLSLLDAPEHVKESTPLPKASAASEEKPAVANEAAAPASAAAEQVSSPAAPEKKVAGSAATNSRSEAEKIYASASPETRKILERIPEFATIAKYMKGA